MTDYNTDHSRDDDPDLIRADIERTRAEMGAKIDRIGERLSPEQLKQQAQESMNEMMTDTANRVSSYVRENRRELSENLVDTIKHNPVPTALIGLGLGWLLVESFSTSSGKEEYGDRYQRRRRAQYARYADRDYDYDDYDRDYDRGRFGRSYDPRYGTSYYRGSVQAVDAEGYPYEESDFGSYPYAASHGESYDERYEPNFYEPAYDERAYDSGAYDQWSSTQGANGRNLDEDVRDRASNMAQQAGDKAQEMGENIRQGAEEIVDRTRDAIDHAIDSAGSQMRDMGEEVSHQAARARRKMSRQTARAGRQMGRQAYRTGRSMGYEARMAGRQVGRQVERSLEENPMTFGLLAFGAGLALSLLLPNTRMEDRTLGRVSDQVKESGYEMAQDAAQRAQHVYEEVRPDLEQAARNVRHDLQDTMDKAKSEARSETEGAKRKAESETGKIAATANQEASAGSTSGSGMSGSGMSGSSTSSSQSSTTTGSGTSSSSTGSSGSSSQGSSQQR